MTNDMDYNGELYRVRSNTQNLYKTHRRLLSQKREKIFRQLKVFLGINMHIRFGIFVHDKDNMRVYFLEQKINYSRSQFFPNEIHLFLCFIIFGRIFFVLGTKAFLFMGSYAYANVCRLYIGRILDG